MKDFGVPTGKITAIRTYATDSKRVEEASKSEKKQVLQSPVAPKVPTPSRTPMPQTSTQEVALEKSVVPTPPPTAAAPTPSPTTAEKKESPTVQPSTNTTPAAHEQVHTSPKESVATRVATEDKKTVEGVVQTAAPATKPATRSIASELASEIEAGSFVTDRKHSRPSLSEIMRSAFSEWWVLHGTPSKQR